MHFINLRELSINTAKVIKRARRGDLVVTVRGKPAALLQAMTEDDLEDYLLAKLIERRMEEHPEAYRTGGGIALNALIAETEQAVARRVRR